MAAAAKRPGGGLCQTPGPARAPAPPIRRTNPFPGTTVANGNPGHPPAAAAHLKTWQNSASGTDPENPANPAANPAARPAWQSRPGPAQYTMLTMLGAFRAYGYAYNSPAGAGWRHLFSLAYVYNLRAYKAAQTGREAEYRSVKCLALAYRNLPVAARTGRQAAAAGRGGGKAAKAAKNGVTRKGWRQSGVARRQKAIQRAHNGGRRQFTGKIPSGEMTIWQCAAPARAGGARGTSGAGLTVYRYLKWRRGLDTGNGGKGGFAGGIWRRQTTNVPGMGVLPASQSGRALPAWNTVKQDGGQAYRRILILANTTWPF